MERNRWVLWLQSRDEFFRRYIGLTKNPCQSTCLDLAMHRYDTTFGTTTHDYVAPGLTDSLKAETLQCPNDDGSRDVRQFRHALGR